MSDGYIWGVDNSFGQKISPTQEMVGRDKNSIWCYSLLYSVCHDIGVAWSAEDSRPTSDRPEREVLSCWAPPPRGSPPPTAEAPKSPDVTKLTLKCHAGAIGSA